MCPAFPAGSSTPVKEHSPSFHLLLTQILEGNFCCRGNSTRQHLVPHARLGRTFPRAKYCFRVRDRNPHEKIESEECSRRACVCSAAASSSTGQQAGRSRGTGGNASGASAGGQIAHHMFLSRNSAHRAHLPIGMLALLLALFSWGLQYKISLYDHWRHPRASTEPPAKLLTDAERPLTSKRAIAFRVPLSPVQPSSPSALATQSDHRPVIGESFSPPIFQQAAAVHRPRNRFAGRAPPTS